MRPASTSTPSAKLPSSRCSSTRSNSTSCPLSSSGSACRSARIRSIARPGGSTSAHRRLRRLRCHRRPFAAHAISAHHTQALEELSAVSLARCVSFARSKMPRSVAVLRPSLFFRLELTGGSHIVWIGFCGPEQDRESDTGVRGWALCFSQQGLSLGCDSFLSAVSFGRSCMAAEPTTASCLELGWALTGRRHVCHLSQGRLGSWRGP